MRVNVYAEELLEETELVVRDVKSRRGKFYGVRVFCETPDGLGSLLQDAERTAITFFIPWTASGGHDFEKMRDVLREMMARVDEAEDLFDKESVNGYE